MRVEATFNDKRISVVNSSKVGKETKSLKFLTFSAAISTMMAMPMFRVNSKSSNRGGRGTSIITRMSSTTTGTAALAVGKRRPESLDVKVFIKSLIFQILTTY